MTPDLELITKLQAENAELRAQVDDVFKAGAKLAEEIHKDKEQLFLHALVLEKALAALPCKYEGTYGAPTVEHCVIDICPPCWAKRKLSTCDHVWNQSDFQPLCVKCHGPYDLKRKEG